MRSLPAPRRPAAVVVSGLVGTGLAVTALVACGAGDGGDTRCRDFVTMLPGDREHVVKDLLSEEGDTDPSDGTINLTVSAISQHCLAPDSADDPVRSIIG